MTEIVKNSTMRNPAFWVCLVLSIGLIVTGFFMPPMAEVDGSVLTAVGELFGFATLEVVYHSIRNTGHWMHEEKAAQIAEAVDRYIRYEGDRK